MTIVKIYIHIYNFFFFPPLNYFIFLSLIVLSLFLFSFRSFVYNRDEIFIIHIILCTRVVPIHIFILHYRELGTLSIAKIERKIFFFFGFFFPGYFGQSFTICKFLRTHLFINLLQHPLILYYTVTTTTTSFCLYYHSSTIYPLSYISELQ